MFTVDECGTTVYPRIHLSDDPWRPRSFRWCPQCHISPSPSLALPVSYTLLASRLNILIPLALFFRWVSLIIVMAGVGLVGFSGSLIKDAIKDSPLLTLVGIKMTDLPSTEPIEEPEVTQVLVGEVGSR